MNWLADIPVERKCTGTARRPHTMHSKQTRKYELHDPVRLDGDKHFAIKN
jgi:hypothetical protein